MTQRQGPWGLFATLAFILVIGACFFLTQLVLAIPYLLATVSDRSAEGIERAAATLGADGFFVALAEFVSGAVALALIVGFAWLRRTLSVTEYLALTGVPRLAALRWLLWTVLLVLAMEGLAGVTDHPSVPEWMFAIYGSAVSMPLLVVAVVVVAPVVEELLFRGFFFEGVRHSWLGPVGAIVLGSLFWAVIHVQYEAFYMGQVFGFGLLLGAARLRTGSTLLPIGMHVLLNAVAFGQLTLEAS